MVQTGKLIHNINCNCICKLLIKKLPNKKKRAHLRVANIKKKKNHRDELSRDNQSLMNILYFYQSLIFLSVLILISVHWTSLFKLSKIIEKSWWGKDPVFSLLLNMHAHKQWNITETQYFLTDLWLAGSLLHVLSVIPFN